MSQRETYRGTAIEITPDLTLQASTGEPPDDAVGIVIFAHGSGSSRHSTRNRHVAEVLHASGLGTVLLDLLTPEEDDIDRRTGEYRFAISMLGDRVGGAIRWVGERGEGPIGLFGASTGAAAALIAAAEHPDEISAVVSRGGRPDLAGDALPQVRAPTLLIVGSRDVDVFEMNRDAQAQMRALTSLEVVPGASHLFEEPGALDVVADLAAAWLRQHI